MCLWKRRQTCCSRESSPSWRPRSSGSRAGLNELADHNDADNDDEDFVTISIRINGGREGLEHRKALWQRARAALALTERTALSVPSGPSLPLTSHRSPYTR